MTDTPRCSHCGAEMQVPAQWQEFVKKGFYPPCEPLYDLSVVALLLPMEPASLRKLLSRNKQIFPARYRRSTGRRRIRVLYGREIRRLRSMVIKESLPIDHIFKTLLPPQV